MPEQKKIELLAPAGDVEKLRVAVHYGADAVYLAGKDFSLRSFSGNFTPEEMAGAVEFAHARGVRVYVACNAYPGNGEMGAVSDFLSTLGALNPDAVIIADPGVLRAARRIIPHIPIHLSTQANTTNAESVRFWREAGVKRINLARELSMEDIREIASSSDVEIETFVHGAMCMAVSGRCLLSAYMTGRSANRGMCAHPCRYRYAVVEEKRPGKAMPVFEDARGTYVFSAPDLCMIDHLPELVQAGVHALKIEGRMKGVHYLATAVNVYRRALDACYADPGSYRVAREWVRALAGINRRGFSTGFFFGEPDRLIPKYKMDEKSDEQIFLGIVAAAPNGGQVVDVRNKFAVNQQVEILRRNGPPAQDTVLHIRDALNIPVTTARPGQQVRVTWQHRYEPYDIIRKAGKDRR